MRQILLLSILLLLTACGTTPNIPDTRDANTHNKILSNQSEAVTAQYEYKELQAKRKKV